MTEGIPEKADFEKALDDGFVKRSMRKIHLWISAPTSCTPASAIIPARSTAWPPAAK